MIKIGMCDDNLESIGSIQNVLDYYIKQNNFNAKIVTVTTNQKEIYEKIEKKELDVLFLDIDFKNNGKNGLDFAKDLRNVNKDFYLIFLTASQRYIHNSLFVKVFDYLIKPVNNELIDEIVIRLKEDFENENKIFLRLNKKLTIRTDEILYIEKIGNRSQIVANNFTEYGNVTLDTLLNELPVNFVKCHRSYIANTNKIIKIDKKDNFIYFSKNIRCPINSHFNM